MTKCNAASSIISVFHSLTGSHSCKSEQTRLSALSINKLLQP